MLTLAIIRQIVISHLPIIVYNVGGTCDDALMVNTALSIMSRQWLGTYNWITLVKGVGFPAFLSVVNFLGIDYISASAAFYALSCSVFVFGMSPLFKRKSIPFVVYAVLLFNPVSCAADTLQRVYRNGITQGQVLLVIGCLCAVYLRRENSAKSLMLWSIAGSFAFAWLWNTREDSIWLLPFVAVYAIVTAAAMIKSKKNGGIVSSLSICSMPFLALILSVLVISSLNLANYGVFTTNELNSGSFPAAVKSIYSVDYPSTSSQNNDRLAVSRETINKLYKYSDTLESIRPILEAQLNVWDTYDAHPGDGEVENGCFFWCLRAAASDAGIYCDAPSAERFFAQIHSELEAALNDGALTRKPVMPSALMAPWRDGYAGKLLKSMGNCLRYVTSFDEVDAVMPENYQESPLAVRMFEVCTNNLALNSGLGDNYTGAFSNRCVGLCNALGKLYKLISPVLAIISCLAYIVLTYLIFKNKSYWIDKWLVVTSIILTAIVLIAGVSYNDVASSDSVNYMYLSAAYPLYLAFCALGCGFVAEAVLNKIKK